MVCCVAVRIVCKVHACSSVLEEDAAAGMMCLSTCMFVSAGVYLPDKGIAQAELVTTGGMCCLSKLLTGMRCSSCTKGQIMALSFTQFFAMCSNSCIFVV
jgi:hypothetical protein